MKQSHPLEIEAHALGPLRLWQVEWNWTGLKVRIRIQKSGVRMTDIDDNPLLPEEFPAEDAAGLPEDTTLEGVLTPGSSGSLVIWDCVEFLGANLKEMPLYSRQLQAFSMIESLQSPRFRTSEPLEVRSWEEVTSILTEGTPEFTAGVVLKKTDSLYGEEGTSSSWWTLPAK